MNKHRKKTLGSSLGIAEEAQVLSEPLQKRLDEFREERNWLIHRCYHENKEDLYDDEKRFALLRRIEAFSEEAQNLQKLISTELEEFVVSQGVNRDWIYQEAIRNINKLKGEKS